MNTLFGMMATGEWMLPASLTVTAIVLTFNGGRILDYLKRRSDAQLIRNPISRHTESAIRPHTASKASRS